MKRQRVLRRVISTMLLVLFTVFTSITAFAKQSVKAPYNLKFSYDEYTETVEVTWDTGEHTDWCEVEYYIDGEFQETLDAYEDITIYLGRYEDLRINVRAISDNSWNNSDWKERTFEPWDEEYDNDYNHDNCGNNVRFPDDPKRFKVGWYEISGRECYYLEPINNEEQVRSIDKTYRYFGNADKWCTDQALIGGYWYRFDTNGNMLTGWRKRNEYFHYYNEGSGNIPLGAQCISTWAERNGRRCYADNTGLMAINCIIKSDGKFYYMDSEGYLGSDIWIPENGKEYYVNNKGIVEDYSR